MSESQIEKSGSNIYILTKYEICERGNLYNYDLCGFTTDATVADLWKRKLKSGVIELKEYTLKK